MAQSTDGYHALQVFPVVVDTGSFTQRFHFRNPNNFPIVLQPRYFPADGTGQLTPLVCSNISLDPFGTKTITSLRTICPALAVGSQFGFLMTVPNIRVANYAAFSRVANPQGNGFSVEAFPAKAFTSSLLVVNGIRRLASTVNSPSFQTNCFVGVINNIDSTTPAVATTVTYAISDANNATLGQGSVDLGAGRLVRLLDVFNAAGMPLGDVDNAAIRFSAGGNSQVGVIAFCTVQDNTSFGADFRIAKQESAPGADLAGPGLQLIGSWDDSARRESFASVDRLGRAFTIAAGNSANTHLFYLHSADFGFCEIINPSTGLRALPAYGLEIRAVDPDTEQTLAGGNDSVVMPDTGQGDSVYFGDRAGGAGGDGAIIVEVESNEQNTGAPRPYKLHCRSGSGMSLGDIVRYQEVIDRF